MAQTILRDYLQQTEDALSTGRIDDAMANCQKIISHFPDSLEAQRLLGEVYLAQGHLEEAQQAFDWVLTSDPENVVAYCDRALISERMSDFDTALDCYQQAYELSRGNSQIRQEFNQLSSKVGQPHFMFSRAGLARLYMRGDLLLQAIQEWEMVLTITPDRLDARIGLLEALWREGLNERVEQLAKQILSEIPTCLKALLLLANSTSTHNISQARELIRQAEALDPELIMANELFSDLLARQPDDPFLALIKKEQITFPENTHGPLTTSADSATTNSTRTNGTASIPLSTDPLFGWSSLDPAVSEQESLQEQPEYTVWSNSELQDFDSRKTESEEADLPTPPAWLDMLTQGEQRTSSGALPLSSPISPSPVTEPEPIEAMPPIPSPVEPEAQLIHKKVPPTPPLSPLPFTPEDSDAENWPEWLKSLGATEMGKEPIVEDPAIETELPQSPYIPSMLDQADSEPSHQPPSALWSDQLAESPAQQTSPAWMDEMAASFAQQASSMLTSQTIGQFPEQEEQTITTLENLEQNLHVQGFVELAPGSLSAIAQETQEPTLSSALAQLGNLSPSQPLQPGMPAQDRPPVSPTVVPPAQSSWFDTPTPYPVPGPMVYSTSQSSPRSPIEPSAIPSYRADALLENELETTMKRPAVRLQPMQQRQVAQRDVVSVIGQAGSAERLVPGGTAESNLSPRERLLRGYQYQLAGDYDESMQEYRIIIRSTPELLSEVISNVRALLKLAPKYSAGYRVLGDAYMRQGEYLQAMEAYNKALSMTKKAKGA